MMEISAVMSYIRVCTGRVFKDAEGVISDVMSYIRVCTGRVFKDADLGILLAAGV